MPEIRIDVKHTCGCTRSYRLAEAPQPIMRRIIAELSTKPCGRCPGPRRILARSAAPPQNGKEAP